MSGWLFGGWPPPPPSAGGGVIKIGEPVVLGTPNAVLFIDAAGKLAQDPGFFDYNKVTKKATLGPGTDLIFARSQASGDAQLPFMELQPAADPGPVQQPSFIWLHERVLSNGVYNHVVKQGWNMPNAPDYDATKGSNWDSWEAVFNNGVHNTSERHISLQKPGGSEIRGYSQTIDWVTGIVATGHVADTWEIQLQDASRVVFADSTGFELGQNRKLFGVDSASAKRSWLGFNVNVLELGDAANTLHVLSSASEFNGNATFDQDLTVTAVAHLLGSGGTSDMTLQGTLWTLSGQLIVKQGASTLMGLDTSGLVLVTGDADLRNAMLLGAFGTQSRFTVDAADAAGGSDGDVHIRKNGANTKMQLNVNGSWKTVTVV